MTAQAQRRPALPFWLRSNFAPVGDELTAYELPVLGELPRALTGTYLRNGPNPKSGFSHHWWLGDGMLHGVCLADGKARWYRNRYVRGNTHVIAHAGRLLSLVEGSLPFAVSPELEALGYFDFDGRMDTPMTAHPKLCPATGELHFFGYQSEPPYLTYYIADARGQILSRREMDVGGPSFFHDFAITERHALFFDSPARMTGPWNGQAVPFAWSDEHQARIGIVPRAGGATRWLPVAGGHLGHTVNAWEHDGRIVLDGIRYAHFTAAPPFLYRWELDLGSGRVHEQQLEVRPVEFPRIDDRRAGMAHRYTYVVEPRDVVDDVPMSAALRRFDTTTGASQVHDFGPRQVAGECVFVPAHDGAAEDEGWLLAFVYDGERDGSDLVVLDARAFDAAPLARVRLPRRVPYGIHGNWVPFGYNAGHALRADLYRR